MFSIITLSISFSLEKSLTELIISRKGGKKKGNIWNFVEKNTVSHNLQQQITKKYFFVDLEV